MKHQEEEDNNTLHSPKEIGDHLRVTSVPTSANDYSTAMSSLPIL